jgi:hypothetical protein
VTTWEDGANQIAAQYAHGHDERLVEGCALCIAEYDAVVALGNQVREDSGCCCPKPEQPDV